MINRNMAGIVKKLSTQFPVITLSGPRQSGKTTLARYLFPDYNYVNLENPANREFAANDPEGFLKKYPDNVIIDEFQRVPDLASYLQVHIDEAGRKGMYILTGSNQFEYMNIISQSLAGRTAILKLLPFSYDELFSENFYDLNKILFQGSYPGLHDNQIEPEVFYSSYIETYLQRDVRLLVNVKDLSLFERFLKLCAGRTGQVVNYTSLANDAGIDVRTLKQWLSVLQASFIIHLLPPYYNNFNKRIMKSPKLFFFDTGLVCNLLGIRKDYQIDNHPLRGEIFETFIFSELLKSIYNQARRSNLYFWRDSNNLEIDFIADQGNSLIAIEVKFNATPRKALFKNLNTMQKLTDKITQKYLAYSGDLWEERYNSLLCGYQYISRINP